MKKMIALAALVVAMFAFTADASAQNNANAQAVAAFHQNCNYSGPVEVGQVHVVSACFVEGFITEYTIIPKVNCQAVDCTVIRIGAVGKVTTGCGGEVIDVECYTNN